MSMKLLGQYVHNDYQTSYSEGSKADTWIWYFLCEAPVPVPLSLSPCPCPLSLPLPGLPQLPSIGSAQLVKLAPPENRGSMLFCEQTCYYTVALVNTSYMLHVQLVHMLTSVTCDH